MIGIKKSEIEKVGGICNFVGLKVSQQKRN